MIERSLREELRDAFETITLPPDPTLPGRIRDSIVGRTAPPSAAARLAPPPPPILPSAAAPAPPAPPPQAPVRAVPPAGPPPAAPRPAPGGRRGRLAIAVAAVVAVAVIAVAIAGVIATGLRLPGPSARRAPPAPSAAATAAPTPAASPSPSPVPSPPAPSPGPTRVATLPGFTCGDAAGGGAGRAGVTAVRVGAQTGYDRFVLQFNGPVPQYEVRLQDTAAFAQGAGGVPVTLQGSSGVLVIVHGAAGAGTYAGATDLTPGLAILREARQLADAGGAVQWGLGLSRPSCIRVFALAGPARLVVDVD